MKKRPLYEYAAGPPGTIVAKATARDPASAVAATATRRSSLAEDLRPVPWRTGRSERGGYPPWSAAALVPAGTHGWPARWACRRQQLVGVAALALAFAEGQYRFARHQSLRVAEQAEANRRIAGLATQPLEGSAPPQDRFVGVEPSAGHVASRARQDHLREGAGWYRYALDPPVAAGRRPPPATRAVRLIARWRRPLGLAAADRRPQRQHFLARRPCQLRRLQPRWQEDRDQGTNHGAAMGHRHRTARLGEPMVHPSTYGGSAIFSPDGKTIPTGSPDSAPLLSDIDSRTMRSGKPRRLWAGSGARRSAPTARRSSPATRIIRRGSGTRTPDGPSANPCSIRAWCPPWRSAPTARRSSLVVWTRRRGSGTRTPDGPSAQP